MNYDGDQKCITQPVIHVIEEIDWLKLLVTSENELWSETTITLLYIMISLFAIIIINIV